MSIAEKFQRKKVFRNPDYLSPQCVPDKLRYRDKEMDKILDEIVFQFDDRAGSNLLVSGPTGTGKSHSLKKICEDVNEYIEQEDLDGKIVYLPVSRKSVYDVFITLNKEFQEYPSKGHSFDKAVTDFAEYLEESKENLILVLDEVDKIHDTRHTKGDPFDSLVYHTTRLSEYVDEEINIMTIMVTNNPKVRDKIKDHSLSTFQPEHIHFPSYNDNQVEEIISDRVEQAFLPGIVKESVIGWLSATISNGLSDIRYGLKALKDAGKNVVRKDKQKVTIGDLQEAMEKIEHDEVKATIKGLNKIQFAALVSLVSKDRTSRKGVNSESSYEEFEKICNYLGAEPRSYSYVRKFIMPKLESQGLITSRIKGLGRGRGQILIYYVRGLEDMLPVVAEVARDDYGLVFRVDGQSVLEGY